jgi:hypothetical protein
VAKAGAAGESRHFVRVASIAHVDRILRVGSIAWSRTDNALPGRNERRQTIGPNQRDPETGSDPMASSWKASAASRSEICETRRGSKRGNTAHWGRRLLGFPLHRVPDPGAPGYSSRSEHPFAVKIRTSETDDPPQELDIASPELAEAPGRAAYPATAQDLILALDGVPARSSRR